MHTHSHARTTQQLRARRASTYSERDAMAGVSENIMLGQMCPVGTGAFALLMDEDKLHGGWVGGAAWGWLEQCWLAG